MAFLSGKDTKILVDDVDLSGYFNNLDETAELAGLVTTTFGKAAVTRVTGLKDGRVTLGGFFDSGVDAVDEEIRAAFTTFRVFTAAKEGLVIGKPTTLLSALSTNYRRSAPVADVVSVSVDIEPDGGLDFGVSLHDLTAETATGNSASVDNAAATTTGAVAHLHVTAASGTTPSLTTKVQHSVDNAVWVDLITFTAATARTKERKTVTGTVNRYLRETRTISGTTPSFTFAVACARQ